MIGKRRKGRRGSALVESALVLGLFLVTFIGIVDFAQIMYLHQSLSERTRRAAREAAVGKLTEAEIRNLVIHGRLDAAEDQPGLFGLKPSNVTVTIADQGTNEQRLKVRVSGVRFRLLSPWMSGVGSNLPVTVSTPLEAP